MKPTANRLLVKVQEEPKPKKGEEPKAATSLLTADVVKVGPSVKDISVKDIVIFAPYGVDEVFVGKEKMLLVCEDLILATK